MTRVPQFSWKSTQYFKKAYFRFHTAGTKNKVDTTYRCEALKEVMSFKCVKSQILKYLFTKHLHTKDTKCFRYFKMIYISQTFDMKDIIDYVINRIGKVYNGYLPI